MPPSLTPFSSHTFSKQSRAFLKNDIKNFPSLHKWSVKTTLFIIIILPEKAAFTQRHFLFIKGTTISWNSSFIDLPCKIDTFKVKVVLFNFFEIPSLSPDEIITSKRTWIKPSDPNSVLKAISSILFWFNKVNTWFKNHFCNEIFQGEDILAGYGLFINNPLAHPAKGFYCILGSSKTSTGSKA